jgi:hypothetical protein
MSVLKVQVFRKANLEYNDQFMVNLLSFLFFLFFLFFSFLFVFVFVFVFVFCFLFFVFVFVFFVVCVFVLLLRIQFTGGNYFYYGPPCGRHCAYSLVPPLLLCASFSLLTNSHSLALTNLHALTHYLLGLT